MKRHATFAPAIAIVATLLASASALAAGNPYPERADQDRHDRGHDSRGNDNRNHDDRGNAGRNNGQRDRGNPPPAASYRDNDRHDWNDHRNDRPDNNRRDWNDHRNDRPDNNRRDWNDQRNDRPGNDRWDRYRSDWDRHPHYNDNRSYDRHDYARYRYNFGFYNQPRGYSYRVWHRGDRLPYSYYDSSYIVADWRPYRLYEPPYGYHWVRVGSDVVLTAIATGVVLDVLYNIWY